MSVNIIYLDLDGPVYPDVTIRHHPDQRLPYPGKLDLENITYWRMCERFRNLWAQLYLVYDFEVVISSSWRRYYNKPECFQDLFYANDLPLSLHKDWMTPILNKYSLGDDNPVNCQRANEIELWLDNHPEVKNYIILDDPISGSSLDKTSVDWEDKHQHLLPHIVLVDTDMGLGSFEIRKIYEIMKKWTSNES